jgi:hypothetical protein
LPAQAVREYVNESADIKLLIAEMQKAIDESVAQRTAQVGAPGNHPKAGESVEYEPSIISLFDILGFKDLLGRAGEDANAVSEMLSLARRFSTPDEGAAENFGWKSINFSDTVVRAVPIVSDANVKVRLGIVFYELTDVAHLQVNLLFRNVLIRGAVTIGRIFMKADVVFGPGLVDAHLLESKHALYPRVIVDKRVLKALKEIPLLRSHLFDEEMSYINRLVRKDTDGHLFVDYLRYALDNSDDNYEYGTLILAHKELVEEQILGASALDGRTRYGKSRKQKAEWLRRYHNRHVKTLSAVILKSETEIQKQSLFI